MIKDNMTFTKCRNLDYLGVEELIADVTGIVLIPGFGGRDCPSNGEEDPMTCCCDECDYMICCMGVKDENACVNCTDRYCPRSPVCAQGMKETI